MDEQIVVLVQSRVGPWESTESSQLKSLQVIGLSASQAQLIALDSEYEWPNPTCIWPIGDKCSGGRISAYQIRPWLPTSRR